MAPDALTCLSPPPVGVELNKALVETVLDQIGTPPIKVTHEMGLRYDALPPFPVDALEEIPGRRAGSNSPLRKAVKNARAALYAIYPSQEPKDLSGEVSQMRQNSHPARCPQGGIAHPAAATPRSNSRTASRMMNAR